MSYPRSFVALAIAAAIVTPKFAEAYPAKSSKDQPKQQQQKTNEPPAQKQTVTIPAVDMTVLTNAKKDLTTATADEKKALNEVNQVRGKLMKGADTKPEIIAATKKVTAAKAEYDGATAPILAALSQRADYKSAQAAIVKADDEVTRLKADKEATSEARMAAAKKAKEARDAASQMRTAALADNSKVTETKKSYDDSAEELNKLRNDFQKSISDDPDLVAAQKALDDAKAKTKDANQKVADANADIAKQKAAREQALAEQRKLDREYAQAKQHASKPR